MRRFLRGHPGRGTALGLAAFLLVFPVLHQHLSSFDAAAASIGRAAGHPEEPEGSHLHLLACPVHTLGQSQTPARGVPVSAPRGATAVLLPQAVELPRTAARGTPGAPRAPPVPFA